MRLFFQVGLPGEAKEAVCAATRAVRGARGLAAARAEVLHFTLAFLGEQPEAALPALVEAGEEARARPRFWLELAGAGAFPGPRRPRVLWLGAGEGKEPLCALAGSLAEAVRKRGIALEPRPFAPHLSVARVRRGGEADARAALPRLPAGPVARFCVGSFELMQSTPGPAGATHAALHSFPLAPAATALP